MLSSLTYGSQRYKFTNPTVVDVTGHNTATKSGRSVRIDMKSEPQPPSSIRGNRLTWRIFADGRSVFFVQQGFARKDFWAQGFSAKTGRHHIVLLKNGAKVRDLFVFTG